MRSKKDAAAVVHARPFVHNIASAKENRIRSIFKNVLDAVYASKDAGAGLSKKNKGLGPLFYLTDVTAFISLKK